MKRPSAAIAFYVFLVFLSGAVVGALAYRLYSSSAGGTKSTHARNPEEYRRKYVAEMRTRLKLNDDQVSRLNVILDATRDRFHAVHERYEPEMKAIQAGQVEQINGILDAAQRVEYEKMRREREKRMKEKRSGGC